MSQDNLTGYETDEPIQETEVGQAVQRITWYNSSAEWHAGTLIERGGLGIEMKPGLAVPPFGTVQKIRHQPKAGEQPKVTEDMVAAEAEVAVIAATQQFTMYWPDYVTTNAPIIMDRYFKPEDDNAVREDGKSNRSGGLSLFLVFRADEQRPRKVWELTFRSFNTTHAESLLQELDAARSGLRKYFNDHVKGSAIKQFARFCVWVKLAAGPTEMLGKIKQGPVTHPILKWPKPLPQMKPEDFFAMRILPDEYQEFVVLRKEVDALFNKGYRQPHNTDDLPELVAAYYQRAERRQQAQISAPALPSEQTHQLTQPRAMVSSKNHVHMDVTKIEDSHLSLREYLLKHGQKGLDELACIVSKDGADKWGSVMFVFGYQKLKDADLTTTISVYLEGYQNFLEAEAEPF